MYAEVMVDIAHANVDRLFTYAVPEGMAVEVGQRVLVPFGAGNKQTEGFVLSLSDAYAGSVRLKSILRTLEPYAVLRPDQLALAKWMQNAYGCLLVEALRLMIPAQLRGGRVREKVVRTVYVPKELDITAALASLRKKDGSIRSPKQYEVLELAAKCGQDICVGDIYGFIPASAQAVRALLDKGYLCERGHEVYRDPYGKHKVERDQPKELNCAQQAAYTAITAALDGSSGGTFLLHGVTGSGKTEVYMQAIAYALGQGGTAIMLVPEIALTPQAVDRFRARFGERVAVLHSRLSAGERYDEWRRIRLDKVDVVVGARSAVFAPVKNLRLIVVDEEHEPSYRSEMTPRYSAAEIAEKRCRLFGAALVLGSATPSVGTYLKATKGKYTLLSLPERIRDLPMPKVEIVDMRAEFAAGNTGVFSGLLQERLSACLAAGEQAILFLNRRGYSTFVSCRGCGYVFQCPHCDVSMTYHKYAGLLKCHYCGESIRLPKICPSCGKPYIKHFGVGTEQVEQQLLELFPSAKALRMDMDTTRGKNAHYELLNAFAKGEAQVLIGTQMVAKGLDLPNVTLVGVIAADAALHIPDYRSAERTFQLLTQVAGRAGRADKPGHVVVQTYSPEHPAITLSAKHDYLGFYQREIAQRRSSLFPPYAFFLRALFVGPEEEALAEQAAAFAKGIGEAVEKAIEKAGGDPRSLLFCGSGPSPIRRKQGLYRYQALLKLARTAQSGAALHAAYAYAAAHRGMGFGALEVNPADMF